MPKVVGFDQSVTKKVTCHKCGAINEYVPNEILKGVSYDYGGGCDSYQFINCANCHNRIILKTW